MSVGTEPRVVALLVARMGSTRLPGKHLKSLGPTTLLGRIIERLRLSETIDELVLATAEAAANAPLVDEAARHGVGAFCHDDEDDVLGRLAGAARAADADVVVCVLADTPFVDPENIDTSVRALVEAGADQPVLAPGTGPVALSGVDIWSRAGLERVDAASVEPRHREHAGLYARENPGFLKTVPITIPDDFRRGDLRLTVDTPSDLELARRVHDALAPEGGVVPLKEALRWLDRHPEVAALNAHVQQRPGQRPPRPALFVCGGGPGVGLGHVRRMLFLAGALRDGQGVAARFAVPVHGAIVERIEGAAFPWEPLPEGFEGGPEALLQLAAGCDAGVVVLDLPTDLTSAAVERLRSDGRRVVVVDQAGEGARAADLALVPTADRAVLDAFDGAPATALAGPEYVLLDPALASLTTREQERGQDGPPRVLVTGGATDPQRLAAAALDGLSALEPPLELTVVVGGLCTWGDELAAQAERCGARVVRDPDGLGPLIAAADLMVGAFGITAYECAALGVPAVLLGHSERAAVDAARFARLGSALALGGPGVDAGRRVARAVGALLAESERAVAMARRGRELFDGQGAARAAAAIRRLL